VLECTPLPISTVARRLPLRIGTVRGTEAGPLLYPDDKASTITIRRLSDQALLGALQHCAREARVQGFSPHDLRRTLISDLLDAGADISTVRRAYYGPLIVRAASGRRSPAVAINQASPVELLRAKDTTIVFTLGEPEAASSMRRGVAASCGCAPSRNFYHTNGKRRLVCFWYSGYRFGKSSSIIFSSLLIRNAKKMDIKMSMPIPKILLMMAVPSAASRMPV
jgi:hypothetical protein